jgi:hypothetical protein
MLGSSREAMVLPFHFVIKRGVPMSAFPIACRKGRHFHPSVHAGSQQHNRPIWRAKHSFGSNSQYASSRHRSCFPQPPIPQMDIALK